MLGKHSGRHALRQAFADLGFTIEGDDLKRAFARFKELADRKGKISSLDLEAIASDSLREREEPYRLVRLAIRDRAPASRPGPRSRSKRRGRAHGRGHAATGPWTPRSARSTRCSICR